VVEYGILPGADELYVLSLVRSLEERSEHPIAKAVSKFAEEKGAQKLSVEGFSALKGLGVKGIIDGREAFLGGFQLLRKLGIKPEPEIDAFVKEASKYAYTVVFAVVDLIVLGAFTLSDRIKKESQEAVQKLKEMGLSVVMLTGDAKGAAEKVAEETGIETVFAEVLPEEKVEKIRELQAKGRKVAMVGDGVNDAPALIQADVGIAVGAGTDVAIESAGIILVKSDPRDLVKVVRIARASYAKMVANLFWAAGYNIVAIPAAAGLFSGLGVLLNPALGALFMTLSTLIVSFNALLLRRAKF
jgi:Cu2+-exporting ATPase